MARTSTLIALLLLTAFAVQGIASIPKFSVHYDEKRHLPNGYLFLTTGELHDVANPILANAIAAMPLLAMEVTLPEDRHRQMTFTDDFFFRENDPQRLVTAGRMAILLLGVLLGLLLFQWTREMFGDRSAILALGLYTFSPVLLANATVVTTDLAGTLLFFATTYSFWKFCRTPRWDWLILTGTLFGLAQITRFTNMFLVLILALQAIVALRYHHIRFAGTQQWRAMLLALLVIGGVGYLAMGIPYGFKGSFSTFADNMAHDPYLDTTKYSITQTYSALFPNNAALRSAVVYVATELPIVVPYHYLKNFLYTSKLARDRFPNFLYGEVYEGGKWNYYLKLLVVKLPPIVLLLFVATVLFAVCRKRRWFLTHIRFAPEGEMVWFLIIPAVFFLSYMSLSTRQLGIRYILPIFPYLFMLISLPLHSKFSKRFERMVPALIGVGMVLAAYSAFAAFPSYASYTNVLAQPSYAFTIDHDAGQGLLALKSYMATAGIERVALSYFGDYDPAFYGIAYENYCPHGRLRELPYRTTPENGVYVVSVANLQLYERECLNWLKGQTPIAVLDGTLLVYRVTDH